MTCAWCDRPATKSVAIKNGRRRVRTPACREHALKYDPPKERRKPPAPTEVTPPICADCGAEITWARLWKDGRLGKNMPIDRRALHTKEPKPPLVCFNPATGRAVTVSKALIPQVRAWLEQGAELHRGHFHRRRKTTA